MGGQSGAPVFSMGHFWGGLANQRHVNRHGMQRGRPEKVLTQERRKTLAAALATFHARFDD
jgi:hypothetical protein